jgi:hypothetical protein
MTEPSNMPHGICPFQSGQPVPIQSKVGLASPGAMQIGFAEVGCAGERCQLWERIDHMKSSAGGYCGMKRAGVELAGVSDQLYELSNNLKVLEPPLNGPSPLMRIAEAMEQLVGKVVPGNKT